MADAGGAVALAARALRKSYGSTVAVDGISFDVRRGETFGLLGPNGAGKSTTIHLLVGALRPDAGEVRIDGDGDPTVAEVRRRVGVAPQALALYEEMTGEENLTLFARLQGLCGARLAERVDWALRFAGLADRRKDRVKAYSGGMKRRLNLACALVHDPPVLLLDEPTAGVDPQSRNHLFEAIEGLKEKGRTILYTTHYMEEAERLCDRVAIVDHGKVLAIDDVDALIAAHGGVSVVEVEFEGEPPRRIETQRPPETVAELARTGVTFTAIRVERPNLETVFLELTGRRLRD
jgi:linearmycin/streptolysin S transport system ATP-binding protein